MPKDPHLSYIYKPCVVHRESRRTATHIWLPVQKGVSAARPRDTAMRLSESQSGASARDESSSDDQPKFAGQSLGLLF